MGINVITESGATVIISNPNQLTATELVNLELNGIDLTFLNTILQGVHFTDGENLSLGAFIGRAIEGVPTSESGVQQMLQKGMELESKLASLEPQVAGWKEKIKEIESKNPPPAKDSEDAKLLKTLKANVAAYNALKGEYEQAKVALSKALQNEQLNLKDEIRQQVMKFTGQTDPKAATAPTTGKAFQNGSSGTGSGYSASTDTGKAQTAGTTPYDSILSSSKAFTADPTSGISLAYGADDSVLQLYDIQAEQQKRQHMMTLFFYYARMAMSGDIGAMYQFMRFIGYVIARDKALQNVWMGTKLIELQETSRRATQKLLDTKVGESAVEQAEWQKELQKIKSEEGIVATSQKLISQMMEEFTQVVETLTNVQKSLLDVNGKVLSNLSVWR